MESQDAYENYAFEKSADRLGGEFVDPVLFFEIPATCLGTYSPTACRSYLSPGNPYLVTSGVPGTDVDAGRAANSRATLGMIG
jgi:hypothetical protein